tara:strand:+ start:399 stop:1106 length:708 start_codon:yes stop_codon:yes gene_type:complete
MIINHKYKFIFLRTKKTAGTSLEIYLSQFCGKDDVISPDDWEAEKMKNELGQKSRNYQLPFREYNLSDWKILLRNFSRKNVRNKYYNHMSAEELKKNVPPEIWNNYYIFCFERNPFEKAVSAFHYHLRVHDLKIQYYPFKNFLNDHNYYRNFHRYSINDKVVINVFQYDKINETIYSLLKKFGIENAPKIPFAKAQDKKRNHYSSYYDAGTKKIVEQNCYNEIEQFGYLFHELKN